MANRRTRRSNRYVEKKRMSVREKEEIYSLIKTIVVVAAIFGLAYVGSYFMVKEGLLDKGYQVPEVNTPVFDYQTATIGTVFNKADKEYYVVFDKFGDVHEKSVYLDSLLTMYGNKEKKLPIYKVDMTLGENAKYASNKSNRKAQKSTELKINGITVIKVKNGKNVLYLEDVTKIAKEFGLKYDFE